MRNSFSGFGHTDADLHHALLGNSLGGGIAYVGVLCSQNYGFGLSASLSGTYSSMDAATVWDMKVFTHELGHNFGSGHTHDSNHYNPVIDTCGVDPYGFCGTSTAWTCASSCPAMVDDSSTIMSYCNHCSGGYNSVDYTFGGTHLPGGDRSQEAGYDNTPLQGSVSSNAKRVNVNMYNHVKYQHDNYSPGCLAVTPTCNVDADCPDETCRVNSCNPTYNTCELQAPSADCCGNGICDGNEDWSSCPEDSCPPPPSDCSSGGCPTISTPYCSSCSISVGNFIKVTALENMSITRLSIYNYISGSQAVTVSGMPGDWLGNEDNASPWSQHYSGTLSSGSWSTIALPRFATPIFIAAGTSYSFYVSSTVSGNGSLLSTNTGVFSPNTLSAQNSDIQVYVGYGATCTVPGSGCPIYWDGANYLGYSWNGQIEYQVATVAETSSPSKSPVTPQPTPKPTTNAPTPLPTNNPVTPFPTNQPTNQPITPVPTKQPTPQPVTPQPTNPPTNQPTPSPETASPSKSPTDERKMNYYHIAFVSHMNISLTSASQL